MRAYCLPYLAVLSIAGSALLSKGAKHAGDRAAVWAAECDTTAVMRALAADTARMRRSSQKFFPADNTEGAHETVYFDRHGPRVVSIFFLGESGRTRVTYFLASPTNFFLEIEDERYAKPLSEAASPTVVSRNVHAGYVCAGRVRTGLRDSDIVSWTTELDSALTRARPSPHK